MTDSADGEITLAMMRDAFSSAVVCDALDGLGFKRQSPRVPLPPRTGNGVLIGRCKTTQWVDMAHEDPKPYELELQAVDSCDIRQMTEMDFPVFARSTCIYDSQNRQRVVEFDVPVEIDGVIFSPGDLVVADVDGVVVVPQEVEGEAVRRAWQKVHDENVTRDAIRAGMQATDAYNKYGIL